MEGSSAGMEQSNNHPGIFEPIQDPESDHLGRYRFAQRLLKRVAAADCSSAVGLYGGWGVGKTSILNLMKSINDQDAPLVQKKPKLIYMDIWPYEVSGDLALPILVRTRQLIGNLPEETYSKSWRRILGVLAQAGMDITLRKLAGLQLNDVKDYVGNLRDVSPDAINIRDLETLVDDIRGGQEAFCELARLASEAHQNRRLVFLIDNLDRCSPENVVRLLESVKNFLYAPNCVWVFAMDSGVIASYIDRKYDGTRMDGNSYLDKIIPEQYHIPPITIADMVRLHRFLGVAQPAGRVGLPVIDLGKLPNLPEVLIPRRLLKTAHKFYEAYTIDTDLGSPAGSDSTFFLILLYYTWPAFYERFSSGSVEHVRGILLNFIPENERSGSSPILIPQRFMDDRSLNHYIERCILLDRNLENISKTLAAGMFWLREAGLP